MTDQTTEPVQPDSEGQGGGGEQDAPYAEYLNSIPEELRGQVEPAFQKWDGDVTRRFQEAAEYKRGWEPYEQLGVNQLPPQEVQELLQFRDALSSPEVIQQWYEQYAEANGLTPQQAAEQQQSQEPVDFFATDREQLDRLLEDRLGPIQQQIAQFGEYQAQQELAVRVAEAERVVEGQLAQLQDQHPGEFDRELIEAFVSQYIESDPQNAVQRAFEDSRKFVAQIEKRTLQGKVDQPAPAESGGVADGNPDVAKNLKEANAQALAMMRAAKAA